MTTHTLDARRLLCPMPVIKLQNLVKNCQSGDRIEITCTDPGTQQDIPMWCKIFKHEVSIVSENNSEWLFVIIVN
ncbi:sulfurtransferase TusA family protein [Candidatus Berkiella cookevillensis]|uniref:Sulfurtransferase TusA n=1 Tax=Candidatus Berkiella cookevillensis TaxID=437022 RepID=A0A0Q9YDW3_9GAMM|nr:sulfurtransferase TusA family protein [Candidatus Berkiella cookevillensis]MCS5709647.1 sulfurtransferase TusA family protein [Candidatus Berkiella cookevillensis]